MAFLGRDVRRYTVWYLTAGRQRVNWASAVVGGRATVRIQRLAVDQDGEQFLSLFAPAGTAVSPRDVLLARAEDSTSPVPTAEAPTGGGVPPVVSAPAPTTAPSPSGPDVTRSYVVIDRVAGVPFQFPARLRPQELHRKLVVIRCLPGSAAIQIGTATRTNNDSQGPTSGWLWTLQPGQELALTETSDQVYMRAAVTGSPPIRVGVYTELRNA